MRQADPEKLSKAEAVFRRHGGTLRTSEAIAEGIHPRTLYRLRDMGLIQPLSRGLFHLSSNELPSRPDVAAVSQRVPAGVVALVSALDLHELTTRIPEAVYLALPKDVKTPRVDYPPLRVVHLSPPAMQAGVEEYSLGTTVVRVFSVAKTVADCFKFRSLVGTDFAVEALREALRSRKATVGEIMQFARIDRVSAVIRPYLEALQ
jgi:predicted transcriptional regulator of viral defense system